VDIKIEVKKQGKHLPLAKRNLDKLWIRCTLKRRTLALDRGKCYTYHRGKLAMGPTFLSCTVKRSTVYW